MSKFLFLSLKVTHRHGSPLHPHLVAVTTDVFVEVMPPVLTTVLEGRVMSYLKMWVHKSIWIIFLIWVLMGSRDLTKSYQKIISPGSSLEILKNTTYVSWHQKWTKWMETSNHNTGCIGYILLVASLGSQLIAGICS